MNEAPPTTESRGRTPAVLWVIATLMAVIAVTVVVRPDAGWSSNLAWGQASGLVGARGVYMTPCQIGQNRYGIVMMDRDASTIWVYEFVAGPVERRATTKTRLEFIAARKWLWDREMPEFNTGGNGTGVRDIQRLVKEQDRKSFGTAPKTDGTKKGEPGGGS